MAVYLAIGFGAYLLSWYYMWRVIAPRAAELARQRTVAWWASPEAGPVIDRVASAAYAKFEPHVQRILDELVPVKESVEKISASDPAAQVGDQVDQLKEEIGQAMVAQRHAIEAKVESGMMQIKGQVGNVAMRANQAADAIAGGAADAIGTAAAGLPMVDQVKLRYLQSAIAAGSREDATEIRKTGAFLAQSALNYFTTHGEWPELETFLTGGGRGGSARAAAPARSGGNGGRSRLGVGGEG